MIWSISDPQVLVNDALIGAQIGGGGVMAHGALLHDVDASGGEQQMLAIARAMMLEPKIILLDEPTEGLMPRMVAQIREIIDVMSRDAVAVLLVEQNVREALRIADRVVVMKAGHIVREALPAELGDNAALMELY